MKVTNSSFVELEKDWEGVLRYASQRYSIGPLTFDDMYQESLIVMWETSQEFSPTDSPDAFRKMFKTKLFHRLSDLVDHWKMQKRDHRKVVSGDQQSGVHSSSQSLFDTVAVSSDASPDEYTECVFVIESLTRALNDDQQKALKQLLDPNSFVDISTFMEKHRNKTHIPVWVHAKALGWKYTYTKNVLASVRSIAARVIVEDF